ncbi:MAG: glycosyltransferase, partial [Patescibacteria group bacterium]|nr:glycosyltransferase [Patescibacteria group bacterium]
VEKTLEKWTSQSSQSSQAAISTIGSVPHLPHGLDRQVFHPRLRDAARRTFFPRVSLGLSQIPLQPDQILLAMTATNSSRKSWETFFSSAAELVHRGRNIFLWGHTDALQPSTVNPAVCWNLPALARQYGMQNRCCLTTARLTDEDLAWAFSAADVAVALSSEGFGYFPFEALACGLPVAGTSYAGSAEFTPASMRITPMAYASEQPFGIQRPIYADGDVADRIEAILDSGYTHEASLLDSGYEWENLWPEWSEWLRKGVEQR